MSTAKKTYRKKEILLVWGFIRTIEIMYKISHIPIEIYEMIYLFQKAYEYFGEIHECHVLDDKKTTMSATDTVNGFGNVVIDSTDKQCYLWKFCILSIAEEWGVGFGIVDNDALNKEWPCYMAGGCAYGFVEETIYSKNVRNVDSEMFVLAKKNIFFENDDIVEMQLDMNCRTLTIKINDAKKYDIITIPDIEMNDKLKYRMGIYLHGEGNTVKLLDYREFSSS